MIDGAAWIFVLLQIFFVDLLLGADNAVIIALACRKLPPEGARQAILFGAIGAIALRLVMILFANALLSVRLVKLIGALMLVVIALNVQTQKHEDEIVAVGGAAGAGDLLSAAAVIMFADAAMSLDNVVALAAIAGGNFWLLATGVLASIPIIAYGGLILTQIIRRAPEILMVGAMILGWIAGEMAASDPLLSGWIKANAPALSVLAPVLVAAFVYLAGQGAQSKERQTFARARLARSGASFAPAPSRPPREPPTARTPAGEAPPAIASRPAIREEPPRGLAVGWPARGGWSEGRVVALALVVLAVLAGLTIIAFAAIFGRLI